MRSAGPWLAVLLIAVATRAAAAPKTPATLAQGTQLKALESVRAQIGAVEQDLLESRESQVSAAAQLRKIRKLLVLQQKEIMLSKKRVHELTEGLDGLSAQKKQLFETIETEKVSLRSKLVELDKLTENEALDAGFLEDADSRDQKSYFLAKTLGKELASVQRLREDVAQAQALESRIIDERGKLDYYVQELGQQMAMLGANEAVQKEIMRTRSANRLDSLRKMRGLRESERDLEGLIASFREKRRQEAETRRMELAAEASRAAQIKTSAVHKPGDVARVAPAAPAAPITPAAPQAPAQAVASAPTGAPQSPLEALTIAELKGRLPMPVSGRIASAFGRSYNSKTNLLTFQKGITLAAASGAQVRAVSAGRVVFAGPLRNYGLIAIVEHPGQYYTLYGQMGAVAVKEGAEIKQGDVLGTIDNEPLYFEIRSRNVAVNPSQWLKL